LSGSLTVCGRISWRKTSVWSELGMTQSRLMSAIGAGANVALDWCVAFVSQMGLFPVVGLQVTVVQMLTISGAFTGVSLVRSYVLRRLFAHRQGA
jgi:hypothetical protein